MHPSDATAIGVHDGDRVLVRSRRGAITVAIEATERVAPGELFMAFHFPEAPANRLTSDAMDDVTSCPEYKVTAVAVTRR
jgi:predicted molibdopterin-dependent oxidoreductase YjgC